MNRNLQIIAFFTGVFFFTSCQDNSTPGYEYMPNMYRSPSIETYAENNIKSYDGLPVSGTLARGYLSTFSYGSTDADYLEAGDKATYPDSIYTMNLAGETEIKAFLKNEETLEEGKKLYGMFCKHCHGATGAGDGTIQNVIYQSVPHFNADKPERARAKVPMKDLKEGHIFHAITYGVPPYLMGPHASQITEEERWKIVYYVQTELQTKELTDSKE